MYIYIHKYILYIYYIYIYIIYIYIYIYTIYNMSGRAISDIQARAEGERLYIRYSTDANVVNNM